MTSVQFVVMATSMAMIKIYSILVFVWFIVIFVVSFL